MLDSEWVREFAMIPKELAAETGPHLAIKPPDMGHPSSGVKRKARLVGRAFEVKFASRERVQAGFLWMIGVTESRSPMARMTRSTVANSGLPSVLRER